MTNQIALVETARKNLAVVTVDLADRRQAAVVTDHDSMVLGRRMVASET